VKGREREATAEVIVQMPEKYIHNIFFTLQLIVIEKV